MTNLTTGIKHTVTYTVRPEDSASRVGSGLLDVFSTPALIALMEKCSMETVQPGLSEEQGTVGTAVDIKHLKATKIGKEVVAEAELTEVDNKKLGFAVNVYEDDTLIATGRHSRYIIDQKKFLERLG